MELPFKKPPVVHNAEGYERQIGFEFEFTGLPMMRAANMIAELYDGVVQQVSTYKIDVEDSTFGRFRLELDASILRDKKYEKTLTSIGIDITSFKRKERIEEALMDMASSVVPFEIITPPIPFSSLPRLNELVDELRVWKAKGTGSSVLYAFGLHINPEIPRPGFYDLLKHLKAFVLLEPWIRKDSKINMSRRITPYIKEFEEDYIRLILHPAYKPDPDTMIRDYIEYNSRNRALDMLPVFSHLRPQLTRKLLKGELTSARPAFHYRLPNCSIQDKSWSLALEWNRWWLVEKMASDPKALRQYSQARLKMKKNTLIGFESKWIKLTARWVKNVQ